MQETWVWFLGRADPLKKGMATHCGILAWRIPRTEEPGGLPCIIKGYILIKSLGSSENSDWRLHSQKNIWMTLPDCSNWDPVAVANGYRHHSFHGQCWAGAKHLGCPAASLECCMSLMVELVWCCLPSSPFNHRVIQMHLIDGLDVTLSLAVEKVWHVSMCPLLWGQRNSKGEKASIHWSREHKKMSIINSSFASWNVECFNNRGLGHSVRILMTIYLL